MAQESPVALQLLQLIDCMAEDKHILTTSLLNHFNIRPVKSANREGSIHLI